MFWCPQAHDFAPFGIKKIKNFSYSDKYKELVCTLFSKDTNLVSLNIDVLYTCVLYGWIKNDSLRPFKIGFSDAYQDFIT